MIGHPREELLLAFQDHRLDDGRRRRLAGHLSGCQRCRNVVQAHRAVRGVFALEAPFAPDGVLERALASRAGGMMVVLPVAEPDAPRFRTLPLRPFVIAAGVMLAVFTGVQVVPMTPLRQAWSDWSRMIADWQPLGEGGVLDLRYPEVPVARAARPDPSRLRPYTATYLIPQRDRPPGHMYVSVARLGGEWQVSEHYGGESSVTVRFDTTALNLLGWTYVVGFGEKGYTKVHRAERSGTDFFYELAWTGTPPASFVSRDPPARTTVAFEHFADGTNSVGSATLWVLLSAMPLKRGWAGSIRELGRSDPPSPRFDIPTTYLVTDQGTLLTRLGRFDAWAVEILMPAGMDYGRTYWFRKSDGLMLKMERRGGGKVRTQYELESVTYH